MSKARTWLVGILLTLSGISACHKARLNQAPEPENKSDAARAACAELNLARDAAWTAQFLHEFVRCAAIQDERNEETFAHSLRLIESIGLDRLQTAMDLLLIEPRKNLSDARVYPNLSALITLMDRGIHDERGLALAGTESRWDTLQNTLSAMRPRPLFQFLMALEDADALDGFLQELMAWSDALPPAALAGLTHKVLTDATVRDDLQSLQKETLDDPLFAAGLKKLWEPRFYPWKGESQGHAEPQSFFGHALQYWKASTDEEQKRWAHSAAAFLRMGLETQRDELLRRTHDLYHLFRSYALRQENFLTDLRELMNQALHTSLKDLEPAMKGLAQIRDNPSYRDAFEEKAGSTYLHELVEDFLWDGGRLQSCTMDFAGLKSDPELDDPRAILRPLLTPQATCQGRVPLLLYLDETLGLNCRTGVCGRSWLPDEARVSAADMKKLGQFAWNWLEKELRADPYRLKNRQLAYGPLDGERLDQLKIFWQEHLPETAADLVAADEALQADPRFAALLKKDFLESWYGLVLQKLNTLPDEFRDVWPDARNPEGWYQKNSDIKLQRIGLGLYAFGAVDAAARGALPLDVAWKQLDQELPGILKPADFSQIISPLRETAGIIKNPTVSIKPETEKITPDWPGSITTHLAFLPSGEIARQTAPYAIAQLTQETADGWMMLTRFRDQLPLLTASSDPSRAKKLESWINDSYLPSWTHALQKELGYLGETLPWDLFEGDALSAEDARMFALFAAQNWLAVTPKLPEGSTIASLPLTPAFTKERAPQAFLGLPVLTGSQQTWAGFWAFDSGFFTGAPGLQDLLQKLPQDANAVRTEFLEAARNRKVLTQGRLNVIDREKLSTQHKLLLQLQAVSSVYQSRGQQLIVPAVGFDAFCPAGQGVGACPFTVKSFASWRRFMEDRVLDHFCPFVSGTDFSADFQKEWRDALGFQDSPAQLAQLCAGRKLPAGSIPASLWENNWRNVLHMGRNPQLKPALLQLPEAIRRLKVQSVPGDYQKFVRFHELAPLWMPVANARLQHREAVYSAFRWHAPGLIDHVIAAYNHEMGDKVFTDALKKLGRLSSEGNNPVFDLIHAVTTSYESSVQAQESTLTFLLRLADCISQDPKLIQTTSRLLEKPEDPFAGILLAYTFPQAMKVGVFEDFAWDHPSYKLMRLAFQSENRRLMLGLVAAFDRLSPKLWKIYQDAASGFPDRTVMAHDLDKLLRFTVDAVASADDEGSLSHLWQDLFKKGLSDKALLSVIRLTHQLREPLVDLQNNWQPSLRSELDAVLQATLEGGLHIIQWLEKMPRDQSFDRMQKALRGMTAGLYERDGTELWHLLQDRRLGLGPDGIIMQQLRDPKLRADLRLVFKAFRALETEWVLAALDEWEELARSTQKVLHYFEKNVAWRGTGAISYQYFIKTLDQQMQDGQKRLRDQLNLIRIWLRREDCEKGNAAC
ncbi:MAG TPA: hypothetical protein VFO10_01145 [Oligoflexus sp.]|uniref:hypothetical protein n=1 Tax=Oligoflexus sp. TaxID=1971216 RepID=UPI002D7F7804|nr:hypothetical protein [Oligoflexus sp.]HET9235822.1 hypothetical protein [Oligoflexus sp.]